MTRPPCCLVLENNKGAFKTIPAKRIKEIRKKGSLNKENLSQIKPAKMMKKASRVEELKSSQKPLSRTSSLEILEVGSSSSVKEKGPKAGASKERKGPNELISMGFNEGIVRKVLKLVNTNEYKRHQTPPILRVSTKAFGMGRRMPIVGKYLA